MTHLATFLTLREENSLKIVICDYKQRDEKNKRSTPCSDSVLVRNDAVSTAEVIYCRINLYE
jgi:hypothetical protein